ncbi:CoA binding domain-containing protein [Mycena maculata]|uniref:CoA binding domain-containing protein n=1 Tax=Mycena maculata TaxID=230809 RepID=A0AAD7NYP3_9AGAR|nr:CoA binding domain-containing protein [Mycena maculata]
MSTSPTLAQKEARFLSAPKFAVVGASSTISKNGFKALKFLVDRHKDVVPINPNVTEVLDIPALKTLSELPDPTHTSVSIVTQPAVTLKILQDAKALGIFALWLQPGAEDDAVIEFIEADAQFADRCVYRAHALHVSTSSPANTTEALTLHEDISSPCLFKEPEIPSVPSANAAATMASKEVSVATTSQAAQTNVVPTLQQKEARFLSASKFAVVGASSTNGSKNGSKALTWLLEHHKDVVPINLKAPVAIQGIPSIKTLSDLPDGQNTSVCVVVPPKATLEILKQAKALGIFALWLQPGAEDDAVVEFLEADAGFAARCVYRAHSLHVSTSTQAKTTEALTLHEDVSSPCLFKVPTTETVPSVVAPLAAAPAVVAGAKHEISSPPGTPPVSKSLKLAPDSSVIRASA